MDLFQWNEEYEQTGRIQDYDEVYHQFLWCSDPGENYHKDVGYNRNHLLGILVCRAAPVTSIEQIDDRMTLSNKSPLDMSLSELKDTLFNLQFEWPVFINKIQNDLSKVEYVRTYVQVCMYRLGRLIDSTHNDSILNSEADTRPSTTGNERCVSESAIRRLMASVLLLNRHIDLYEISDEVAPGDFQVPLSLYTHEASNDEFHKLCMHYFLPIAGKLQYKHDFPGMYNNVSQAVYFHDANYRQIKRNEYTSTDPIHMLPSVLLLYPEITVKYEDDLFNPIDPPSSSQKTEWYWLLLPRRIYLVSPEPKVYYSTDLSSLVRIYVEFQEVIQDED